MREREAGINHSQAAINASPPTGVKAPSTFKFVSVIIYKLPENTAMPTQHKATPTLAVDVRADSSAKTVASSA